MKTPRKSERKKPKNPSTSKLICMPIPSRVLGKPSLQQEEKIKQATGYFNIYKELINHYNLTQTREIFILRIANDPKIPLQFKSLPLLRLLRQTVQEMMMNDIELVMWSIYLDRFAWKEFSPCLKIIMYITAFAVKFYLSSSIEHFQAYLSFKFTNFSSYFNKWLEKSRTKLFTSPKELNKKFNHLSSRILDDEVNLINYNYHVDEILEMAPPYQHEICIRVESQPSSLHSSYFEPTSPVTIQDIEAKEVQSDEDGPNIPLLARLDSVFASNMKIEDQPGQFDLSTGSFGVGNSWMLESLDQTRPAADEEPLPQLAEHQSLFTYYLSQSSN
jgi:hypothetical protein